MWQRELADIWTPYILSPTVPCHAIQSIKNETKYNALTLSAKTHNHPPPAAEERREILTGLKRII